MYGKTVAITKEECVSQVSKTGILNLFLMWGQSHPLISASRPQSYKWGQFIEKIMAVY